MEIIIDSLKICSYAALLIWVLFLALWVLTELKEIAGLLRDIHKKQKEDTYHLHQNYQRIEENLRWLVNDLHFLKPKCENCREKEASQNVKKE